MALKYFSSTTIGVSSTAAINRRFLGILWGILGLSLFCILIFSLSAYSKGSYRPALIILSSSIVIAIAASMCGVFLGFIFGFPHSENSSNHSFKDISEWLSKIIVGLGLVELKTLYRIFNENILASVQTLDVPKSTAILFGGLIILYSIIGFVLSYFLTVTEVLKRIISTRYDIEQIKKRLVEQLADVPENNTGTPKVGSPEQPPKIDKLQFNEILQTIDDIDPVVLDSQSLRKLAKLFFGYREYAKAARFFRTLYEKEKADPMPLLNAAYIMSKYLALHTESTQLLTELIKVSPDFAPAYYNLACNAVRMGDLERAKKHMQTGLQKDRTIYEKAAQDAELEPIIDDIKAFYDALPK